MLTHIYTVEVDHDFRRWLTAIGKFTYGTLDYQGDGRRDKTYSAEGDLIYKMTRNLWVKGTLRRDVLDSNIAGNSTASTVVMRMQVRSSDWFLRKNRNVTRAE